MFSIQAEWLQTKLLNDHSSAQKTTKLKNCFYWAFLLSREKCSEPSFRVSADHANFELNHPDMITERLNVELRTRKKPRLRLNFHLPMNKQLNHVFWILGGSIFLAINALLISAMDWSQKLIAGSQFDNPAAANIFSPFTANQLVSIFMATRLTTLS